MATGNERWDYVTPLDGALSTIEKSDSPFSNRYGDEYLFSEKFEKSNIGKLLNYIVSIEEKEEEVSEDKTPLIFFLDKIFTHENRTKQLEFKYEHYGQYEWTQGASSLKSMAMAWFDFDFSITVNASVFEIVTNFPNTVVIPNEKYWYINYYVTDFGMLADLLHELIHALVYLDFKGSQNEILYHELMANPDNYEKYKKPIDDVLIHYFSSVNPAYKGYLDDKTIKLYTWTGLQSDKTREGTHYNDFYKQNFFKKPNGKIESEYDIVDISQVFDPMNEKGIFIPPENEETPYEAYLIELEETFGEESNCRILAGAYTILRFGRIRRVSPSDSSQYAKLEKNVTIDSIAAGWNLDGDLIPYANLIGSHNFGPCWYIKIAYDDSTGNFVGEDLINQAHTDVNDNGTPTRLKLVKQHNWSETGNISNLKSPIPPLLNCK